MIGRHCEEWLGECLSIECIIHSKFKTSLTLSTTSVAVRIENDGCVENNALLPRVWRKGFVDGVAMVANGDDPRRTSKGRLAVDLG